MHDSISHCERGLLLLRASFERIAHHFDTAKLADNCLRRTSTALHASRVLIQQSDELLARIYPPDRGSAETQDSKECSMEKQGRR